MVQRPDDDADARDERATDGAPAAGSEAAGSEAPGSQRDFEERWARIVAELGEPDGAAWADDGPDEPEATDPVDDAGRQSGHVVRPAPDATSGRALSGRDWDGTAQFDAAEEAVDGLEHFVPPDPGPAVGSDPLRTLTWAVAIGVPVLYVVMLLVWRDAPGWLAPVAGALFLAAVGVLVWRMPHRHDREDGDSGAVV